MHKLFIALFPALIVLFSGISSSAEQPPTKYAIGLGLDVSSGSYGGASRSTFVSAPVIIDWFPTERIDLELTLPLLYQRTSGTGHVAVDSAVKAVARGYMGGAGTSMNGAGMSAAGSTVSSSGNANASMGRGGGSGLLGGDLGLGDITLTCGYVLVADSETLPLLRPTLYAKFPTADESRGQGTGEFDFGAGIAVSKWFGNWQPFTEGRFVFQGGAHDETGAENFVTADAGIAYSWNERLVTSTYARFGTASFDDMAAPVEARVKMVWRFGERTYTDIYALKGLSNGSPDYGGGASVFMEF